MEDQVLLRELQRTEQTFQQMVAAVRDNVNATQGDIKLLRGEMSGWQATIGSIEKSLTKQVNEVQMQSVKQINDIQIQFVAHMNEMKIKVSWTNILIAAFGSLAVAMIAAIYFLLKQ